VGGGGLLAGSLLGDGFVGYWVVMRVVVGVVDGVFDAVSGVFGGVSWWPVGESGIIEGVSVGTP
jgi:hypothetical protein